MTATDPTRDFLRHTVATLAYRGGKAVRGAPASFADFRAGDTTEQPLRCEAERLFQGPIADAFTHIGQIAILRRLAADPVRGENYFRAEIKAGRVGDDQAPPKREFH